MKKYVMPGVLIVFVIIIIFQTYSLISTKSELKTIKSELVHIKDINGVIQGDLKNCTSDINSTIESTLNKELGKSHLTKDVRFTFNKNEKDGYILNVRIELSKLKDNSNILFMYKDKNSNDWQELELKRIAQLSYTGDFHLTYDKNYEYKVIIKGEITESGDVKSIDKSDFMPSSFESSWGYNEEGLYLTAYPDTMSEEENNTKIKKLEAIVSHNKKEKTYICKYKDGEDMYDDDNNEVVDEEAARYELDIPKKDYNGKLDYIKLKITYDNGIIDIVDVTNNNIDE